MTHAEIGEEDRQELIGDEDGNSGLVAEQT